MQQSVWDCNIGTWQVVQQYDYDDQGANRKQHASTQKWAAFCEILFEIKTLIIRYWQKNRKFWITNPAQDFLCSSAKFEQNSAFRALNFEFVVRKKWESVKPTSGCQRLISEESEQKVFRGFIKFELQSFSRWADRCKCKLNFIDGLPNFFAYLMIPPTKFVLLDLNGFLSPFLKNLESV